MVKGILYTQSSLFLKLCHNLFYNFICSVSLVICYSLLFHLSVFFFAFPLSLFTFRSFPPVLIYCMSFFLSASRFSIVFSRFHFQCSCLLPLLLLFIVLSLSLSFSVSVQFQFLLTTRQLFSFQSFLLPLIKAAN